ncbi:amidohydrolase family protein [Hyphomonas sp.]|uniref:amidohydrolase n=1 Tax=Hyphomonas sp. TaxID=87 RepID=UPI0030F8B0DE
MRNILVGAALLLAVACSRGGADDTAAAGEGAVIYPAASVVTMVAADAVASAVAVKDGRILATGTEAELAEALPNASVDRTFEGMVIVPGLIDPHVHVMLGALQYNLPLTPPWPMATPHGMRAGIGTREGFLAEVAAIEASTAPGEPIVIYGYHNLVHGDLTRTDLDAITTARPLVIWHYSSHDFYLNSAAIERAGFTPALAEKFHGVDLDENGELTGRIYEDAAIAVLGAFSDVMLAPENVSAGFQGFSRMLHEAGVTTTVEMGYGLFGWEMEDANIRSNWGDAQSAGYNLYLVPEYRALQRSFGEDRVQAVRDMVSGVRPAAAPVLPRVKFFTDGAFYSQTMRLSPPGYLSGQSKGSEGLWVMKPDEIAPTIQPYWDAGLGVNIHSNGDAAQGATLMALKTLRKSGGDNSFTIEHGGLFSPHQVEEAGRLKANVSAASHYVYYMADTYADPLGQPRARWISPLGALTDAGVTVTVHSDAPLAPPEPLRAASVHITRATREGGVYEATMALTPYEALESVTLDAARAVGLEAEIGSIEAGKRADFTILGANPLDVAGENWTGIPIWGVVLAGEKRPLED